MFRGNFGMEDIHNEYDDDLAFQCKSCLRAVGCDDSWDNTTHLCEDDKKPEIHAISDGKWVRATVYSNGSKQPIIQITPVEKRKSRIDARTANARKAQPGGSTQTRWKRCDAASGCSDEASSATKRGVQGRPSCRPYKVRGTAEVITQCCMYPGCDTQACFGMPQARPVYCPSHKKGPMIRLLSIAEMKQAMRRAPVQAPEAPEAPEAPAAIRAAAEDEPAPTISGGNNPKKSTGVRKGCERATPKRASKQAVCVKGARKVPPPPRPTTVREKTAAITASLPAKNLEARKAPRSPRLAAAAAVAAAAAATVAPSEASPGAAPLSTCPILEAPSEEIRIVHQAREKARAEAEASGRGRRARVPSLKAIQASALIKEGEAQAMERARKLRERKQARERSKLEEEARTVELRSEEKILQESSPNGSVNGSEDDGGASEPEVEEIEKPMDDDIMRTPTQGKVNDGSKSCKLSTVAEDIITDTDTEPMSPAWSLTTIEDTLADVQEEAEITAKEPTADELARAVEARAGPAQLKAPRDDVIEVAEGSRHRMQQRVAGADGMEGGKRQMAQPTSPQSPTDGHHHKRLKFGESGAA